MNYIHQMKRAIAVRDAQLRTMDAQIQIMQEYLHGPKFTGVQADGERKDWIATGDVIRWLHEIRSQSIHAGESMAVSWSPCINLEPIAD